LPEKKKPAERAASVREYFKSLKRQRILAKLPAFVKDQVDQNGNHAGGSQGAAAAALEALEDAS